jgi:hypothetical protein
MLDAIFAALDAGQAIPYMGPGVLALAGEDCPLPASPEVLVARLTKAVTVPHKIRNNLTAAAQFIENFKHRQTAVKVMKEAFGADVAPTALHHLLAAIPDLPLLVHAWYDNLPQKAMAVRGTGTWGIVQGASQAEHFGQWVQYFTADGTLLAGGEPAEAPAQVAGWSSLLYQPIGSVLPNANFLVSDSDYVEVLTEIDIQTPIPERVQQIRVNRNFLFLGCRFSTQLERIFARQIMKRSSDRHWAVLSESPTKNERRFLAEQNVAVIDMPLADFTAALAARAGAAARRVAV